MAKIALQGRLRLQCNQTSIDLELIARPISLLSVNSYCSILTPHVKNYLLSAL